MIDACNGNAWQSPHIPQDLYKSRIDFKRLEVQLAMSPDFVKTVNLQNANQDHVVIDDSNQHRLRYDEQFFLWKIYDQ